MSLVKCRECGHEVSSRAHKCHNCGAPVTHRLFRLVLIALLGGIMVTGLLLFTQGYFDDYFQPGPTVAWALPHRPTAQLENPASGSEQSAPESQNTPEAAIPTPNPYLVILPQGTAPGYVTAPGSLERRLETMMMQAIDGQDNERVSVQRVIAIIKTQERDASDQSRYAVTVMYRGREETIPGRTREMLMLGALRFAETLFTDPTLAQVTSCTLKPHLKVIDKYGQEHEEQVGNFTLRRAVAERVVWKNMNAQRVEQLLHDEGDFWLHPTLSR
jgi:hypothetical protein